MYQVMFFGGVGMSILLFLMLVILFVKGNIFHIICDLTGIPKKAKKSKGDVEQQRNRETDNKRIIVKTGETTERLQKTEETTLLSEDTTILREGTSVLAVNTMKNSWNHSQFVIVEDIVVIHSEEIIW